MTEQTKPCPFCGNHDISEPSYPLRLETCDIQELNVKIRRVKCFVCGASTDWFTRKEHAIDAWNRRAENSQEDNNAGKS